MRAGGIFSKRFGPRLSRVDRELPALSPCKFPPWSDRYKWAKDTLHAMSGGAPPPPDNKGMRKRQEDGIVQATKVEEEESHNRSAVEGGGDLKGSLGNRRRLHKPAQPVRWPRKPSLFFFFPGSSSRICQNIYLMENSVKSWMRIAIGKNLFRRSLIEGRTVQLLLAFSVVYEVT